MPRPFKPLVPGLSPFAIPAWAVQAKVSPRTMTDYLTGKRRTLPAVRAVIENTLREAGRADLIRQDGAA